MLKQRVITAVILMLVLLPALFSAQAWPFALLSIAMIAAAAWEWSRLNGRQGLPAYVAGAGLALATGITALGGANVPAWLWWAAWPAWVLGGSLVLSRGVAAWPNVPQSFRQAGGLLLLWLAWLAIWKAKSVGLNFLLSTLCLVWMADIAAYFSGRAFGRRKLAPSISPGKSWEGVIGGMVGVAVLAGVWMQIDARVAVDSLSLYSRLWQQWGVAGTVGACAALAGMSVVGDLFESLVKRAAGAKDSSQLLPGHGGVLDRIDALLPVCPLALALIQ